MKENSRAMVIMRRQSSEISMCTGKDNDEYVVVVDSAIACDKLLDLIGDATNVFCAKLDRYTDCQIKEHLQCLLYTP